MSETIHQTVQQPINVVTGECQSRLSELTKYTITDIFSKKYVTGGSPNNDGVDIYNTTNPDSQVIYYIGGIKYVDNIRLKQENA